MIQVRKNVFETNSSSSHSLVIRKDDIIEGDKYFTHEEMLKSLWLNKKTGKCGDKYCDWYFGRCPFRILQTFGHRVEYAYANLVYDKEKIAELESIVKELVPEFKGFGTIEEAGVDEPFLEVWMGKYNISLKEYLTNKKYITIQDGDEYCIWADLYKSGIIDKSAFEDVNKFNEFDYPEEDN